MIAFCLTFGFFGIFSISMIGWAVLYGMYCEETYCKETIEEDKIYKISYKAFLSMYSICPSKWDMNPKALENCILYKSYYERIEQYFYFSFIDYFRFKSFLKEKQNYVKTERMAKVLKSFRKDIEDYDKKNTESLKKELKNIAKEREKF